MSIGDGPHRTYVITRDMGQKILSLRHTGVKTPDADDPLYTEIQDELEKRVQAVLPEDVLVGSVSMTGLADDILAHIYRLRLTDPLIVSTCAEIATPMEGNTLSVNRLVNIYGEDIGRGPRPGHKPIDAQIAEIGSRSTGRPIMLVEDGAFRGETLKFVVDAFVRQGLKVHTIVMGFRFASGAEALRGFEEMGIEVVNVAEFENLYEWVPDHDFFPFVPNCGKVLGFEFSPGVFLPVYSNQGASFSVPYIRPFGPMEQWASISDQDATASISLYCIRAAKRIFTHLAVLNGRPLTVGEVLFSKQRASIPYAVGQANRVVDNNALVGDVLNDLEHEFILECGRSYE